MSRSKHSRIARVEAFEQRILLSAVTDVITAAMHRASDLTQYSNAELNEAREWAVNVDPASDINRLRHDLGAQVFARSELIQDVFLASFPTYRTGVSIIRALETFNPGQYAWPIILQDMQPRLVPNDPMFPQQWHLQNTGQSGGMVGADANITSVWDNYLGAGVVFGIVDDGVTPTHADLNANYRADLSWDFVGNDPDPSGGSHGTSVAGVAGARGNNSVGVTGAAPLGQHAGIKLLGATSDTNVSNALVLNKHDIHIYNNSWGPSDSGNVLGGAGPLSAAALKNGAETGRNGLGNLYVWAGGNGGNNDNVNFDSYANSRFVIPIGALTNTGVRSSYSEAGAPLLVSAYSSGGTVGITTTSSSGYTSSFGGTSSASPLAAGIIGLMLEANPTLTWRDVQHVLANSAFKVDPGNAGWTMNGAGHEINHLYGFGAIDAAAAVALAQTWSNVPPEVSATTGVVQVNQPIPNLNTTGVSHSIQIADPIKLESVEVVMNITHTARGQLQIILTSPSGTESVLATKRSDTGDHFNNWVFSTKRNWDEDARGTWTIRVIDDAGADTGTFNSFTMNLYGTQLVGTPAVYGSVYDDANANGVRDSGEVGLANVQVYVDLNENGMFDVGEPDAMTNSAGAYSIADLELGENVIRAVAPPGLRLSQPSGGSYTVELTKAQNFSTNNNFGFVNPRIAGTVFNDPNDNGVFDTGETGMSGVVVFIDVDDNGMLDAGEPNVTTGSNGAYSLGGLDDGTYIVRAVTPSGQRLTLPGGGSHMATISDATPAHVGRNFGFTDRARIVGTVYNDANGNGMRDPGENPIPDARVYHDLNDNGVFDNSNGTFVSSDVPRPVPDPGTIFSVNEVTGLGSITKVTVKLTISTTWAADIDIYLISPTGTRIELSTDNGGSADNYIDTVFDDDAATSITQGTPPFTGTYRPEQPLSTFIGESANGTWQLEVTDDLGGFPGTLQAWSLTINSTEPNMFTDVNGEYAFAALTPGNYIVRQVPIDDHSISEPASGFYDLTLGAAALAEDVNFGNTTVLLPNVASSQFDFDGVTLPNPPHSLRYSFTQNVGASIDSSDLQLVNTTSNTPVPTGHIAVSYDSGTNTATFTFPGYTDGVLPDGQYTATLLAAGVTNGNGNPMPGNHLSNFFVLAGDANHDGVVNLDDFNIMAQNFGQSPRIFSDGDFNYDGVVNLDDFNILASKFGASVGGGSLFGAGTRGASPSPFGTSPIGTGKFADADDDEKSQEQALV